MLANLYSIVNWCLNVFGPVVRLAAVVSDRSNKCLTSDTAGQLDIIDLWSLDPRHYWYNRIWQLQKRELNVEKRNPFYSLLYIKTSPKSDCWAWYFFEHPPQNMETSASCQKKGVIIEWRCLQQTLNKWANLKSMQHLHIAKSVVFISYRSIDIAAMPTANGGTREEISARSVVRRAIYPLPVA